MTRLTAWRAARLIPCAADISSSRTFTNVTAGNVIRAAARILNICRWQVNPVGLMHISAEDIPMVAANPVILVNIWTIVSHSKFVHTLKQENNIL